MSLKELVHYHNVDNSKKDLAAKLDEEFIKIMIEIEKHFHEFNKHEKIRIEQWTKKLCQITSNFVWKQNRNIYALMLLDCAIKQNLTAPFNKLPQDGPLPSLNKQIIKNRLEALETKVLHCGDDDNITIKISETESPIPKGDMSKRTLSTLATDHKTQNGEITNDTLSISQLKSILKLTSRERPNLGDKDQRTTRKELQFKDDEDIVKERRDNSKMSLTKRENSMDKKQKSIMDSSKTKNTHDMKEILKLKTELEIVRLNEKALEAELNSKIMELLELQKKIEISNMNMHQLEKKNQKYMNFVKYIQTKISDNSVKFANRQVADEIYKEINTLNDSFPLSLSSNPNIFVSNPSLLLKDETLDTNVNNNNNNNNNDKQLQRLSSPTSLSLIPSLSPSSLLLKAVLTNNNNNNNEGKVTETSNIFNLSKMNNTNIVGNCDNDNNHLQKQIQHGYHHQLNDHDHINNKYIDISLEEMDNYLIKASNHTLTQTFTNDNISMISKSDLGLKNNLSISHHEKDTTEFLAYLENFQRENERLKKATEEVLKVSLASDPEQNQSIEEVYKIIASDLQHNNRLIIT